MKKFIIVAFISTGLLLSAAMHAVAIHEKEDNHEISSLSLPPFVTP